MVYMSCMCPVGFSYTSLGQTFFYRLLTFLAGLLYYRFVYCNAIKSAPRAVENWTSELLICRFLSWLNVLMLLLRLKGLLWDVRMRNYAQMFLFFCLYFLYWPSVTVSPTTKFVSPTARISAGKCQEKSLITLLLITYFVCEVAEKFQPVLYRLSTSRSPRWLPPWTTANRGLGANRMPSLTQ